MKDDSLDRCRLKRVGRSSKVDVSVTVLEVPDLLSQLVSWVQKGTRLEEEADPLVQNTPTSSLQYPSDTGQSAKYTGHYRATCERSDSVDETGRTRRCDSVSFIICSASRNRSSHGIPTAM